VDKTIVLTIEKLAGLGDGVGHLDGQRIFVPYTLPGDVVRARVIRTTKDAVYASLEDIITQGNARAVPVCRHFTHCGGCSLQHVDSETYLGFKQQMAREAVKKAGFNPDCVEHIVQIPPVSRRRVELKIADGRLGYYAEHSHNLVGIEECKVLEPALEELILRLKPELIAMLGLSAIQINRVDEGYDIVLTGEKVTQWHVASEREILRVSVQEKGKFRTLYQSGQVAITLGGLKVEIPPGVFLQASRQAQMVMTQRVLVAVGQSKHVLDLFAGIGTYSFPLTSCAEVTAVEGDGTMVAAMQQAALQHGLKQRLKASQRDLFHSPVDRLDVYDAVVINPPRVGAKEQIKILAGSSVKKLVMVSCNPATFSRDARALREGGYILNKVLPVDQFVYSSHLEMIAEFSR